MCHLEFRKLKSFRGKYFGPLTDRGGKKITSWNKRKERKFDSWRRNWGVIMETIDFGCQVRVLNRQRLTVTSSHPQLSQCAAQFLAKVRQQQQCGSNGQDPPGWMKLRLSERGLRIYQPYGVRKDEGFESDSDEHSDTSPLLLIQQLDSSGGSSGVNSSSSDIEEPELMLSSATTTAVAHRHQAEPTLRFRLEDILSCQHPPSLGRHVCLLTLKSQEQALDILALECTAPETARVLTLLCQKICSSPPSPSSSSSSSGTGSSIMPCGTKSVIVPIQSWSERSSNGGAKSPEISPHTPPPASLSAGSEGGSTTKTIVKKLERQNSGWMMLHKKPDVTAASLNGNKSGIRRSETMHHIKINHKNASTSASTTTASSTIISLKTPEAPLIQQQQQQQQQPRWAFRRPTSPTEPVSKATPNIRRGRSVERSIVSGKSSELTVPVLPLPEVKIKRDQSKTRSFLMKFTSGGRKSPTVEPSATSTAERPSRPRGRSLIRSIRSSTPGSTNNPAGSNTPQQQQQQQQQGQTFLIPTKSGQELGRNPYPKEVFNGSGMLNSPLPPLPQPQSQPQQQQQQQQQLFHLVRPFRVPPPPHWPTAYWTPAGAESLLHFDGNNNHHHLAHPSPSWIYFHHHPAAFQHHQAAAAAVAAAAAAANASASLMSKAELKRIKRSRSQSPRR